MILSAVTHNNQIKTKTKKKLKIKIKIKSIFFYNYFIWSSESRLIFFPQTKMEISLFSEVAIIIVVVVTVAIAVDISKRTRG